jgi:hypothetical protein
MDKERALAVVRMLFLIHSVRSAYASSTISSARMSENRHESLYTLIVIFNYGKWKKLT